MVQSCKRGERRTRERLARSLTQMSAARQKRSRDSRRTGGRGRRRAETLRLRGVAFGGNDDHFEGGVDLGRETRDDRVRADRADRIDRELLALDVEALALERGFDVLARDRAVQLAFATGLRRERDFD